MLFQIFPNRQKIVFSAVKLSASLCVYVGVCACATELLSVLAYIRTSLDSITPGVSKSNSADYVAANAAVAGIQFYFGDC